MTANTLLQIFLFLQVFIAGVLAAIGARYAYEHYRSEKPGHEPAKQPAVDNRIQLSAAQKQHLLKEAESKFESVVKNSSTELQHELDASGEHMKDLINRLATEIVEDEMQRYREELGRFRAQASSEVTGVREEIIKHETELKAKLAQEIEAEKQRLVKQIDTKLADAVGSFLADTLQHNVDLGSQTAYLLTMLEEHKAEFVKEVQSES